MKKAIISSFIFALFIPISTFAADDIVIDIAFPVEGAVTFQNDFDQARSGGRTHNATDIMASKMTHVFAAVDGRIAFAPTEEPSYGYIIYLDGDDGYRYSYIHLNNDTPGTDDGNGGSENAYAPGIRRGVRVERGQHIAYVGDSGNAENIASHLHFEIYDGDTPINPYKSLLAAQASRTSDYDPATARTLATSFNADRQITQANGAVLCESNSLIKTADVSTVYYCGADGGRYVFQNETVFYSWFENFNNVQIVTAQQMGDIPLRGVVTYRPGSYMVKIESDPKVYAVDANGTLRWITGESVAKRLYGNAWAKQVQDVPSSLFARYTVGEAIY